MKIVQVLCIVLFWNTFIPNSIFLYKYIPNIKKSKWCKDITVSSTNGSVLVKCLWKDDKRKWEPMEHVTDIKFPSYIDEIREKLIEIDQSDSDCSD